MKHLTLLFLLISSQIRVFRMIENEWQDEMPFDGYMYYYEGVTNELQSLLTNRKVNLDEEIKDFTDSNNSTARYNYGSTPIISQRKFIENQVINFKKNTVKKIGNLGIMMI